jgi:hypothetical protein
MKTKLITLLTGLLLSATFIGCNNAEKRAAEIIAAKEQAEAQAKLEAEIAKLRADAEANSRNAADARAKAEADSRMDDLAQAKAELERATADARKAQADALKIQADAKAKAKALADAEEAAKRGKADAEMNRKLAELKDAATRADSSAKSARAAAALAAELLRQSKAGTGGTGGIGTAPPPFTGQGVIGSSGGKVVAADGTGASVTIPPGALNAKTPVSVVTVPPPAGAAAAVVCTPAGKVWNPPVTVKFRLPPTPVETPGTYKRVRFWNPTTQAYIPQSPPVFAMVDADPRFASALVPHFSTIAIMDDPGVANPDQIVDDEAMDTRVAREHPEMAPPRFPEHSATEGEDSEENPEESAEENPSGEFSPDYAPSEPEDEPDMREEDGHPDYPREGEDESEIIGDEDLIPR